MATQLIPATIAVGGNVTDRYVLNRYLVQESSVLCLDRCDNEACRFIQGYLMYPDEKCLYDSMRCLQTRREIFSQVP